MAVLFETPLVIVNDDDLVRVSRDNPGYRFEREEDGTIIVSPTHTKGGAKSLEPPHNYGITKSKSAETPLTRTLASRSARSSGLCSGRFMGDPAPIDALTPDLKRRDFGRSARTWPSR